MEHDEEILPGIQAIVCFGHTPGLQMIKLSDDTQTVVYCADTIPTAAHLPLPWVMGYDLQPAVTVKEKHALLKKCYEEDWQIFFGHDPAMGLARIGQDERGKPIIKN